MNKKNTALFVAYAGIIGAVYVALCLLLAPISYGPIQFRVAEALCILPYFTPAAIPGVSVGCLLANILGGADILDIIFGTLATVIGAFGSYALRKHKFLVCLPPIISNTVIIPWVLRFAYMETTPIIVLMGTVGLGEVLAIGVLGTVLLLALNTQKDRIFRHA